MNSPIPAYRNLLYLEVEKCYNWIFHEGPKSINMNWITSIFFILSLISIFWNLYGQVGQPTQLVELIFIAFYFFNGSRN